MSISRLQNEREDEAHAKVEAEIERLRAKINLYESVLKQIWNDGRGIPGCDAEYLSSEALRRAGEIG